MSAGVRCRLLCAWLVVVAVFPFPRPVAADHVVAMEDVHTFGDAAFFGSTDSHVLNAPLVGVVQRRPDAATG